MMMKGRNGCDVLLRSKRTNIETGDDPAGAAPPKSLVNEQRARSAEDPSGGFMSMRRNGSSLRVVSKIRP